MKFLYCLPLLLLLSTSSQPVGDPSTHAPTIKALYDNVLTASDCYENLRFLCKNIGGRLSGSPEADKAVEWGKSTMEKYGFDKVWLQEVMVPVWQRGHPEKAYAIVNSDEGESTRIPLHVCALGGSVGTDGNISAELVEVASFEALKTIDPAIVEGKIVLLNQHMDAKEYDTFRAYGGCYPIRSYGAMEGGNKGAVAILARSLTLLEDDSPHTGSLWYGETKKKIPAAAISTNDANLLSKRLGTGERITVQLEMTCRNLPDKKSFNVIGELTGSEFPESILLVGGHLDSWDNGEGAHDDGAGVVQSIEVLRLFQKTGIRPRHTLRAVLYMNEENGNNGGKTYASEAKRKGEVHLAAIESDRGGFSPRGFHIDASDTAIGTIQSWGPLLEPYGLHIFEEGYAGVDIGPLEDGKVVLIGLVPDSQRYFDHHHSENDVFEAVNKRELELGAGAMAALVYLIDQEGITQ